MQKRRGLVRLAMALARQLARQTDRPTPTACWTWTGTTHVHGYVRLRALGRELSLPVAAYLLAHGRLPEGRLVRRCRGGIKCANPSHYVERAKKKRESRLLLKEQDTPATPEALARARAAVLRVNPELAATGYGSQRK